MYVRINTENKAVELIPDVIPEFPQYPIEKRYSKEILAMCVHVAEDADVHTGMIYDPETGTFSEPVVEEPVVETATEGEVE